MEKVDKTCIVYCGVYLHLGDQGMHEHVADLQLMAVHVRPPPSCPSDTCGNVHAVYGPQYYTLQQVRGEHHQDQEDDIPGRQLLPLFELNANRQRFKVWESCLKQLFSKTQCTCKCILYQYE